MKRRANFSVWELAEIEAAEKRPDVQAMPGVYLDSVEELADAVRRESALALRMARACKPPKRIEPKRGELWPQN